MRERKGELCCLDKDSHFLTSLPTSQISRPEGNWTEEMKVLGIVTHKPPAAYSEFFTHRENTPRRTPPTCSVVPTLYLKPHFFVQLHNYV